MENIANTFKLSIRMDLYGFSMSVSDDSDLLISTNRVDFKEKDISFEKLLDIIGTETKLNYNKLEIIYVSDSYVVIPLDFFNIDEAPTFLYFEHKPLKTDTLIHNIIHQLGIVIVSAIPSTIQNALNQLFPNINMENHISNLISNCLSTRTGSNVFCSNRANRQDIIVMNGVKLLFVNSFSYQTAEDFAFNILNVYEKLDLDTHSFKLISDGVTEKPELEKLLDKYLTVLTRK